MSLHAPYGLTWQVWALHEPGKHAPAPVVEEAPRRERRASDPRWQDADLRRWIP